MGRGRGRDLEKERKREGERETGESCQNQCLLFWMGCCRVCRLLSSWGSEGTGIELRDILLGVYEQRCAEKPERGTTMDT